MRNPLRAGAITLSVALVVAACSGDDAAPTTTTPSTTTTAVSTTTAAPVTTPATTPEDDLATLLAAFDVTPLRLTYVFTDGNEETTVILSHDPTADPPVEAVLVPEADAQLITTGAESIFCDTADARCFTVPGEVGDGLSTGLLGRFAGALLLADQLGSVPGAGSTRSTDTVAGRAGICFTFTPPPGFDTDLIRQCVDSELGFTLVVQTGADQTTVMEIVDVGDPLDSDFTPAGPVSATP